MNKIAVFIMVLLGIAGSSLASVTFSPSDADLADLPHASWFTWGINYTLAPGETITSAVLTYHNIWDWRVEQDRLATHLLDNPALGTKSGSDTDGGNDYFATTYAGTQVLVGNWNDPVGGRPRNRPGENPDLTYVFGVDLLATLNTYAATSVTGRANFGFGIDPDCHYYNDGITFEITTANINTVPNIVPAPGAVLLGGIGITLVGWMKRRRTL